MAGNDVIDGGDGIHDMISYLEKPNPINDIYYSPTLSYFVITFSNMAEYD